MLTAKYNDDEQIVFNGSVEDGLYYLNAGYEDLNDWKGIKFQIETEDIDGDPVIRTYAIAKVDQLDHIQRSGEITSPVYKFANNVGTYEGHFRLGYFDGYDEISEDIAESEIEEIDIFPEYNVI